MNQMKICYETLYITKSMVSLLERKAVKQQKKQWVSLLTGKLRELPKRNKLNRC